MTEQNWRTETDATDYFGHQKKKNQVADRRPVIRKPSDLVGPGIAANAIRITDFNDHLATFDGFFAAAVGALNAPNGEALVGFVSSDSELGGVQTFVGLTTSQTFQRVFNRNPSDAATLYWGDWEVLSDGTGGASFLETLPVSIIDAKGDIIVGTADNVATVKPVGADGYSLVADDTAEGGVDWAVRVATVNPVPDSSITVDNSDPLNPLIGLVDVGAVDWEYDDRHTVLGSGDQTARLTYEPVAESLQVMWHAQGHGGLPMLSEDFTIDGQYVTIPDPGYFIADDMFSFQYEHFPFPPLDMSFVAVVNGVFHGATMTFTPPVDMEEGDFFVIAVRGGTAPGGGDVTLGATSGDPRATSIYSVATPGHEDVFTGFHTASTSDVVINITPNPSFSPGAYGVMIVLRGVNGVADFAAITGGTTPEVEAAGAVAVTWDGNASFSLVTASPPTGYTEGGNTGLNYSATDVSYWFDITASSTPAGSFGGQGCLVIGLI